MKRRSSFSTGQLMLGGTGRTWTPQQEAIFAHRGPLCVDAKAGCGKTTTAAESGGRKLGAGGVAMFAFNLTAREDLCRKTDPDIHVKTLGQLGHSLLVKSLAHGKKRLPFDNPSRAPRFVKLVCDAGEQQPASFRRAAATIVDKVRVIYTDNETNMSSVHPCVALQQYRRQSGRQHAKLVVVGITPTPFTIADPNDAGMLDVVGFDTASPEIISSFARGELLHGDREGEVHALRKEAPLRPLGVFPHLQGVRSRWRDRTRAATSTRPRALRTGVRRSRGVAPGLPRTTHLEGNPMTNATLLDRLANLSAQRTARTDRLHETLLAASGRAGACLITPWSETARRLGPGASSATWPSCTSWP